MIDIARECGGKSCRNKKGWLIRSMVWNEESVKRMLQEGENCVQGIRLRLLTQALHGRVSAATELIASVASARQKTTQGDPVPPLTSVLMLGESRMMRLEPAHDGQQFWLTGTALGDDPCVAGRLASVIEQAAARADLYGRVAGVLLNCLKYIRAAPTAAQRMPSRSARCRGRRRRRRHPHSHADH